MARFFAGILSSLLSVSAAGQSTQTWPCISDRVGFVNDGAGTGWRVGGFHNGQRYLLKRSYRKDRAFDEVVLFHRFS